MRLACASVNLLAGLSCLFGLPSSAHAELPRGVSIKGDPEAISVRISMRCGERGAGLYCSGDRVYRVIAASERVSIEIAGRALIEAPPRETRQLAIRDGWAVDHPRWRCGLAEAFVERHAWSTPRDSEWDDVTYELDFALARVPRRRSVQIEVELPARWSASVVGCQSTEHGARMHCDSVDAGPILFSRRPPSWSLGGPRVGVGLRERPFVRAGWEAQFRRALHLGVFADSDFDRRVVIAPLARLALPSGLAPVPRPRPRSPSSAESDASHWRALRGRSSLHVHSRPRRVCGLARLDPDRALRYDGDPDVLHQPLIRF